VQAYVDPGVDYYEQKYQQRLVRNLTKKAHSLGFELVPQSVSLSVTADRFLGEGYCDRHKSNRE
jgi:hypothetical protein